MRFVGFIGPSYQLRSVNVDCQRCVNLYPELNEIGTGKEKEVAALVWTPGLSPFATLGDGPIRGLYTANNGVLYAVSGEKLYSVESDGTPTERGTLTTSVGKVSIVDNGTHLLIVDGTYGYVLIIATNAFAKITDEQFLGGDQATFQDGYFIFNVPGTGQFSISGLNSIVWDALEITTAEGKPDNLVGLISDHRDLWLFGTQSIEVFYNTGNADFPFERISGAYIEHGCAARWTIAKMNNSVFWLGQDDKGAGIVYMAQGYRPQRISTHAVERAIQSYGDVSDAVAYSYQDNGHHFYVINFTSAATTWVFDTSTNLWHERTYTNEGVLERHRANFHAFAYSKHIVGDYENGKLYELSATTFDDDGAPITRERAAPHLSSGLKRVFHNSFQLDIETGAGLDGTSQGSDPQVMLQFSDDGGHSWSNEKWTSFGKIGQRRKRAIWRRLGNSRDRVYRIRITDPVKVTVLGAEIDVAAGGS